MLITNSLRNTNRAWNISVEG